MKRARPSRIRVYVDTCVLSDIAAGGRSAQYRTTLRFWQWLLVSRRYQGVTSTYVDGESKRGRRRDRVVRRSALIQRLVFLPCSDRVAGLAHQLRQRLGWGADMVDDAVHLVAAAVARVPVFVTWDRRLLGHERWAIGVALQALDLAVPAVVTPVDLMDQRSNPPRRLHAGADTPGVREVRAIRRQVGRQARGSAARAVEILTRASEVPP